MAFCLSYSICQYPQLEDIPAAYVQGNIEYWQMLYDKQKAIAAQNKEDPENDDKVHRPDPQEAYDEGDRKPVGHKPTRDTATNTNSNSLQVFAPGPKGAGL